jgi:hypothetical protein
MIALQYQLSLPTDYDIEPLRTRIPEIGKRFDAMPGLGIKAFLLRKQGVDGSPVTQYAPFYLWTEPAAAAEFLWGSDGFTGVVRKYGRPAAQTWIGGGYRRGAAFGDLPTHAVRTVASIEPDMAPSGPAVAAEAMLASRLDESSLHSAAWAIDPRTWELMTFTLHAHRPDPHGGELYDVPHLSSPHEADLHARHAPGADEHANAGWIAFPRREQVDESVRNMQDFQDD